MIALIILGSLLLILLLLCLLRLRVVVTCGERTTVKISLGAFSLYPAARGRKKAAKTGKGASAAAEKPAGGKSLPRLSVGEAAELLQVSLDALSEAKHRICRNLRIEPLEVSVIIGRGDPAETAAAYGYASAALWTLLPRAEELFRIPDPAIHLGADYEAEGTTVRGRVGCSVRVGALMVIVLTLALPVYRWYRRSRGAHRAGNAESCEK